jgi:hypothetical protein
MAEGRPLVGRERWSRPGLRAAIGEALRTLATERATFTVDDLAPLDQFHSGGVAATRSSSEAGTDGAANRSVGGPSMTALLRRGAQESIRPAHLCP